MTGLQKIDSGEVYINGFNIQTDFEKAIERVGGIIESPDNYQYLSGYDNLMMYARLYPDVTKKIAQEVRKFFANSDTLEIGKTEN